MQIDGLLRTRSQYSFLNSTLRIEDIVSLASSLKMKYVALTDVENFFGSFKFCQMAESYGIKPILGVETSLLNSKFLLIAESNDGLVNISKWLSLKEKSLDILAELADDVILVLLPNQTENFTREDLCAEVIAYTLHDIFGDNFYIGIDQREHNKFESIAPEKVVLTPNVAYLDDTDYELVKLINTEAEKGLSFKNLTTGYNKCVKNMQEIADRCMIQFKQSKKDSETEKKLLEKLRKVTIHALENSTLQPKNIYQARLDEELKLVAENNLASFICSVIELVNYARLQSIPISPGRGSAASLLLLYLTNVTMLDPIKFNLKYERFFSSNNSFDIDIEVASSQKEKLLDFLFEKHKKIFKLPVFKRISLREIITKCLSTKDESEIIAYEEALSVLVSKGIVQLSSKVEIERNLLPFANSNLGIERLVKLARIANLKKGYAIHPSAIVYDEDLLAFKINDQSITWFDKNDLKQLKVNQLDLLSSVTLDEIQRKLCFIEHPSDYTEFTRKLNYSDRAVYKFLQSGSFEDVFQFNDKWKWLLREKKPYNLQQLAECIAMQRPGVIDNKNYYPKIRSSHLKRILYESTKDTGGKIVYQEQLTDLLSKLLDIPYFDAEKQRKQLKNIKISEYLNTIKQKTNCNDEDLKVIEEIINLAGQYTYNKSHAIAYAMIVYQTALLEMLSKLKSKQTDHVGPTFTPS